MLRLLKPCAESWCSATRSPRNEKPPCRNRTAPRSATRGSPWAATKTRHSQNKQLNEGRAALDTPDNHLAVEITSSTCCGFEDWFYGYCKCFEDTKSSIWQLRMQHEMLDSLIDLLTQGNLHWVLSEIL